MRPRLALSGAYGDWVVVEPTPQTRGKTAFLCRCRCGCERVIRASHLLSGRSKCCGGRGHHRSRGGDDARWIDAEQVRPKSQPGVAGDEKPPRGAEDARTTAPQVDQGQAQHFGGESLLGCEWRRRPRSHADAPLHGRENTAAPRDQVELFAQLADATRTLARDGWHFSHGVGQWVRRVNRPVEDHDFDRCRCDQDPWRR